MSKIKVKRKGLKVKGKGSKAKVNGEKRACDGVSDCARSFGGRRRQGFKEGGKRHQFVLGRMPSHGLDR